MLTSFTIKNFRGFSDFTIDPLERINLIIGKNNVGKTALLEAIFLLLGATNPALTWRLNVLRGVESMLLDPEEVWGWLFYNRATSSSIELESVDTNKIKHDLILKLTSPTITQISPQNKMNTEINMAPGTLPTTLGNKQLAFKYTSSSGKSFETRGVITNGKVEFQTLSDLPFPTSFLLDCHGRITQEENARHFSKLEAIGQHEEIIDIMKIIEPNIKRLIVSTASGAATLMGDVGTKQLLPIFVMGDGVNKLLSIILAIASARNGVVLVDELENGLHHSVMKKVWEAVGQLAHKTNTQVIATTHSMECIKAAHEAFYSQKDYDFSLCRLERANKKTKVVKYDRETLNTSIDLNWEVR